MFTNHTKMSITESTVSVKLIHQVLWQCVLPNLFPVRRIFTYYAWIRSVACQKVSILYSHAGRDISWRKALRNLLLASRPSNNFLFRRSESSLNSKSRTAVRQFIRNCFSNLPQVFGERARTSIKVDRGRRRRMIIVDCCCII